MRYGPSGSLGAVRWKILLAIAILLCVPFLLPGNPLREVGRRLRHAEQWTPGEERFVTTYSTIVRLEERYRSSRDSFRLQLESSGITEEELLWMEGFVKETQSQRPERWSDLLSRALDEVRNPSPSHPESAGQ